MRLIAAGQVIGSILGLVVSAMMLSLPDVRYSTVWSVLIPSMFAMSAGYQLWRNKPMGIEMSIMVQFLQTVEVARPYTYELRLGPAVRLLVENLSFELAPSIDTSIFFGSARAASPYAFAINVTAVISFCYLLYYWIKHKDSSDATPAELGGN